MMRLRLDTFNSTTGVVIGFLFVLACTALPIWWNLHLPMVDLPNHIARHYIATMPDSSAMHVYYDYALELVPNTAVDLLWLAFGTGFEPAQFSNLIIGLYAANLVLAALVLGRVVQGRFTIWPLAAALLVFNTPFFWGLQNFIWSVPFTIYGFALWLALQERPWIRFLTFICYALALYQLHFFAFGFLAALVLGREAQVAITKSDRRFRRLGLFIWHLSPFGLPIVWLLIEMLSSAPSAQGNLTKFAGLTQKPYQIWEAFQSLTYASNATEAPQLALWNTVTLWLIAMLFLFLLRKRGMRLVIEDRAKGAIAVLFGVAFFSPTWLNGVGLVDARAPFVVAVLVIASSRWEGLGRKPAIALTALIAVVIAARGLAFERFSATYTKDVATLIEVTQSLQPGDRLLPLRAEGLEGDVRFFHVQALLVAEHDIFVPTLFQGVHAVKLKPEWAAYGHPQYYAMDLRVLSDPSAGYPAPGYAEDWQQKFTHVVLLDQSRFDLATLPALNLQAQKQRFSLYEVVPE